MKQIFDYTQKEAMKYQPESAEECKGIDCRKCVYYSYVPSSSSCPFEAWMINHPVEKPTDTSRSEQARELLAKNWGVFPSIATLKSLCISTEVEQEIIDSCKQLQDEKLEQQIEPLRNMINVLDLIIEIEDKQAVLTKTRQEQPVQEDQSNIPLWFMPSMENANDYMHGRDYYHHCPQKNYKLVRLNYLPNHKEHLCPICKQTFVMK